MLQACSLLAVAMSAAFALHQTKARAVGPPRAPAHPSRIPLLARSVYLERNTRSCRSWLPGCVCAGCRLLAASYAVSLNTQTCACSVMPSYCFLVLVRPLVAGAGLLVSLFVLALANTGKEVHSDLHGLEVRKHGVDASAHCLVLVSCSHVCAITAEYAFGSIFRSHTTLLVLVSAQFARWPFVLVAAKHPAQTRRHLLDIARR
jgi:hypothetical protein